jgi:hypothetical protein
VTSRTKPKKCLRGNIADREGRGELIVSEAELVSDVRRHGKGEAAPRRRDRFNGRGVGEQYEET